VYGVNVMVRRTRLERIDEGITAEGGVRRGLGENSLRSVNMDWLGTVYSGEG
jgi:hypothetical protein